MSKMHIVFGAQGAGKSTYSMKLATNVNGIHMSIDEWMWNLFGTDMPQPINLKWIMDRVDRCERQIWKLSKQIAINRTEVILDLGFTKVQKRNLFLQKAAELNFPTQLHYIKAPHALRRKRVLNRNTEKGSTFSFEVTPGMFDFMEGEFHSATDKELVSAIVVDTTNF
jgi:predicted kinase